jgi:NSS family neurotransmitter:Na+ symporter
MPALLVLAVILLVRVVTLPPQPAIVDRVTTQAVASMNDADALAKLNPDRPAVAQWNQEAATLKPILESGDVNTLRAQQGRMRELVEAISIDDLLPLPETAKLTASEREAAREKAFNEVMGTLGGGVADLTEPTVNNGFGFLWNPDWRELKNFRIWLEAAGQVFFTLSVGIGAILTYASYLRREDDVALSGLTASATNEFAEVILGGSIVIPLAFVFLGASATAASAKVGTYDLGFLAMPRVLMQMPAGNVFGFMWFLLLFLAGVTSSISLAQPALAFLEDEFNLTRKEAALIFGVATFILCHIAIFAWGQGAGDELDFWGGTLCLVVFGLIEAVMFAWVFGIDKAWTELHAGSDIRIPGVYRFIIKYVTPVFLLAILAGWMWQFGMDVILLRDVPVENKPVIITIRLLLVLVFAVLSFLVWAVWRRRGSEMESEVVE